MNRLQKIADVLRGKDLADSFVLAPDLGERHAQKSSYGGYGSFLNLGGDGVIDPRYARLTFDTFGAATAVDITIPLYSSVTKRQDTVGGARWLIRRKDNDEIAYDSDNNEGKHPLAQAIQAFHNQHDINLFDAWELSRMVAGQSYIHIIRNDYRYVTGLEWLNPLAVTPYAPNGKIQWFDYRPIHGGGYGQIKPTDMVYDRRLNLLDEFSGTGAVEVAIMKASIILNSDKTLDAHLKNETRPGMVVSPSAQTTSEGLVGYHTFKPEQVEKVKRELLEPLKGANNSNRSAVLSESVSIVTFDSRRIDSALLDAIDKADAKIYEVMGVPPAIAGNANTSLFQRSPEDIKVYHMTILNELDSIDDFVNRKLLPAFDDSEIYYFEHDKEPFLHIEDTELIRLEMTTTMLNSGAISIGKYQSLNDIEVDETLADFYIFDGIPIPKSEVGNLWKYKLIVAPSVYNSEIITGEPLPQPVDPAQVIPTDSGGEEVAPSVDAPIESHTNSKTLDTHTQSHADPSTFYQSLPTDEERLKELDQWEQFTRKENHKRAFVPVALRGDLADYIQENLAIEAINYKALFEQARERVTVKTFEKTRVNFQIAVDREIKKAIDDKLKKRGFIGNMGNIIKGFGIDAFKDGLEDGGVKIESALSDDDMLEFNMVLAEQRDYIRGLADAIYVQESVSEALAKDKPILWSNKTLRAFYQAGLVSADKNGIYLWKIGGTEKHCADCSRMNGQAHRMKDYYRKDILPGSSSLECFGGYCDCRLERISGRARGNW